jgi:hypothetical protein
MDQGNTLGDTLRLTAIVNLVSFQLSERRQLVLMTTVIHNVTDCPFSRKKCIRKQLAVAAPRHGFGAQKRDPPSRCELFHFGDDRLEFASQHEIGVRPKRADSPGAIRRVRRRFAKSAEITAPDIIDSCRLQLGSERFAIEMRQAPRCRPASHVDNHLDIVRFQQLNEYADGSSRMANRMNRVWKFAAH